MRAVWLIWGILLTATPMASAQGWANKLFKDQTSHDFGNVARGAQLHHRFAVTNPYAVPLEFTNVRVSCGCLTATPNVKVLQPRESGWIDIFMDARRFNGPKTVNIFVTVGPTFISTAELKVLAVSRADIVFNPGQVSFGTVAAGQTPSQTLDVEYAGALDWKLTEVLAKDLPFDVALNELYRRPGQVGYQLKVTLKADAPAGALRREFHIRTSDPATPLIGVHVEADVQASLSLTPSVLRLGMLQSGDSLTRKVVVRAQKPFKILGVDGLGEGISQVGELSTTPAATHVLSFKCELTKAGDFRKQLQIRTDHQTEPLTLTIEAAVSAN